MPSGKMLAYMVGVSVLTVLTLQRYQAKNTRA